MDRWKTEFSHIVKLEVLDWPPPPPPARNWEGDYANLLYPPPLATTVSTNYLWVGDSPYVLVSRETSWQFVDETMTAAGFTFGWIKPGVRIKVGTIRLIIVEHFPMCDDLGCVLDTPLGRLRYRWQRIIINLNLFYHRTLHCLFIFKLADYHEAVIPSYRDINLVKRLERYKDVIFQWCKAILPKSS